MFKYELKTKLELENSIRSVEVSNAFDVVDRNYFVPKEYQTIAYSDTPLPIGDDQTISAPHMSVLLCELANLKKGERVLEVGTGSGYLTALISSIVGNRGKVVSVDVNKKLLAFAKKNLAKQEGLPKNYQLHLANGMNGFIKHAPYHKIIVSASAKSLPPALVEQLKPNGLIVIPVGEKLMVFKKNADGSISEFVEAYVNFVPLLE